MSANTSSDNSNKMSTAAKSAGKKSTAKPAEVAAPAPVAAAAPPAPAKATKAKKAEAPVAAAPAPVVAAPVIAATPATEASTEEDVSVSLTNTIAQLHEQLTALKGAVSTAAATLKTIEKQAGRVVKKAERRRKRKSTTEGGEAKPCIFTKEVRVSDDLCAFLGKPKGSSASRSAVTKAVIAYAKSHNLMDKQNIKADAALRKLLSLGEGDNLSILTLQKHLRNHYVKTA
jgi:chromatin remodeling complex protein RSC6